MRKSSKLVITSAAAAVVATLIPADAARAVNYVWNVPGGGAQSWQVGTNWTPAGFPNSNVDTADLRINLANNLTLDVGPTDVTTAGLFMGGTGNAVTTDVVSTGGRLLFENPDDALNGGAVLLSSSGAVGTVNTISAPITALDTISVDPAGTQALTISGPILNSGGNRSLNNNSPQALTVSSAISLSNDATNRTFTLGAGSGAGLTTFTGSVNIGTGGSTGGTILFGSNSTSTTWVYPTIAVNGTIGAGVGVNTSRAIIDVQSDTALIGGNTIQFTGSTNAWGSQITSTNGPRTVTNAATRVQVGQFTNFIGNNALTFNGLFGFSANRGIANFITDNPATVGVDSLTFNNDFYASNTTNDNRVAVFAGPGNTVINGNLIHTNITTAASTGTGSLEMRGTGTLTINGTGVAAPNTTLYQGNTRVRGGLLQLANYALMSNTSGGATVEAGGTFGLLNGSIAGPDSASFLAELVAGAGLGAGQSSSNLADPDTSRGAIALATADAAANINFTAGPLNSANTVNMGIGAQQAGLTYTGTITPANSTYKLGGGGKLTLPNAQLTGANNVKLDNGGVTALQGANTYTGVTTVGGNWIHPFEAYAKNAQGVSLLSAPASVRVNSTLEVTSLADGGSPSSIGSAGNAASNLVLNGGTLRYAGAAASNTDRLFTIGTNGATLDSSGTAPVNFTNAGAIAVADAGTRAGNAETGNLRFVSVADVSDITPGMTVTGTNVPVGTTVSAVQPASTFANFGGGGPNNQPYYIILSQAAPLGTTAIPDLVFGNQNRTLSLTGSNTGNNTVAGALANSANGTLAVNKTDAGRWVLSGNNTYTGGTTVQAGTLAVSRMHENNAVSITGGRLQVLDSSPTLPSHPSGNNAFVSRPSSLSIANNGAPLGSRTYAGQLDLGNNDLILDYDGTSPIADIEDMVRAGYNGGNWLGNGITSSTANANANFAVGVADNSRLTIKFDGTRLFSGQVVDDTTILVKFTHRIDLDLDGVITTNDATIFNSNYVEGAAAYWSIGDVDYDGVYTSNDATLFNGFYSEALASVPEPATFGVLAVGALGLLGRRRRTR